MSQQDYYEILEVSSEASSAEIKRAYRRLALQTHPDRNRNDPRAEERFKKISEAYGVLSDPGKRAQYDHYRKLGYRRVAPARVIIKPDSVILRKKYCGTFSAAPMPEMFCGDAKGIPKNGIPL